MAKKRLFLVLIVNTLLLANVRGELLAESKSANSGVIDLETIMVSTPRIKGKAEEAAYNITVIDRSDIEEAHAKSTPDLMKNIEGVYVYDSSGVGTAGRVNMRGFWGGMSSYQLVLIDGIPQNKASDNLVEWDLIPPDNIESIEIIRGPVSALYGDNAMSGVISIITKEPTGVPKIKLSGSYAAYNTQNYNGYISGIYKKIGYYVAVSRKSTDGFRRHCDYGNINVLGKLDFKLNKRETLKISSAYHERAEGAYPWALPEGQLDEDRRRARPGTQSDKSKTRKSDSGITYINNITEDFNMEGTFYYRYEARESFYTRGALAVSTQEQIDYENIYGLLLRVCATPKIFKMDYLLAAGVDLEKDVFDYKTYRAPFQGRGPPPDRGRGH